MFFFGPRQRPGSTLRIRQNRFHKDPSQNGAVSCMRGARCSPRLRTDPVVSTDPVVLTEAAGALRDALKCIQAVMHARPMRAMTRLYSITVVPGLPGSERVTSGFMDQAPAT